MNTLIQAIRRVVVRTNSVDMGHMTMIVLPSLGLWDGKAGKYAYVWFTTQIEKRSRHMSIGLH